MQGMRSRDKKMVESSMRLVFRAAETLSYVKTYWAYAVAHKIRANY